MIVKVTETATKRDNLQKCFNLEKFNLTLF